MSTCSFPSNADNCTYSEIAHKKGSFNLGSLALKDLFQQYAFHTSSIHMRMTDVSYKNKRNVHSDHSGNEFIGNQHSVSSTAVQGVN